MTTLVLKTGRAALLRRRLQPPGGVAAATPYRIVGEPAKLNFKLHFLPPIVYDSNRTAQPKFF